MFFRVCGLLLLACASVARAAADPAAESEVWNYFGRGHIEGSAGAGFGTFDGNDYLILQAGAGYYLRDGLTLGLSTEAWLGAKPQVYDVSPQVRYVFVRTPWSFKPYLGTFYRRTYYSQQFSPQNSAGLRAGLVFPISSRAYFTAGGVYEHYFSCDTNLYSSCDQVSPELGLGFGF